MELQKLIEKSAEMGDFRFRMALEEAVKSGGSHAETELAMLLTSTDYPLQVQLNLIRVAGYLQKSQFLLPLKKIIEGEEHPNIKREAIIAVSKFADRRALNILHGALEKSADSFIQSTIAAEISRIKHNNPLFSLLPRFQQGSKNPRLFKTALDILGKILAPADAKVFISYLADDDKTRAAGAFEIICRRGDLSVHAFLADFFRRVSREIAAGTESQESFSSHAFHYGLYLQRFPELIGGLLEQIEGLLKLSMDSAGREALLEIVVMDSSPRALALVEDIFLNRSESRKTLIGKTAGREAFLPLMQRWYIDFPELRRDTIAAMASLAGGLEFIRRNFAGLPLEEQEAALESAEPGNYHLFRDLVHQALSGGSRQIRLLALEKAVTAADRKIEPFLFPAEEDRELRQIEDELLVAAARLFPIRTAARITEKLISGELSAKKIRDYLRQLVELAAADPLQIWEGGERLRQLFSVVIRAHNRDLGLQALQLLQHVNPLRRSTMTAAEAVISQYAETRREIMNAEEKSALKKAREHLSDWANTCRDCESGLVSISALLASEQPDLEKWRQLTGLSAFAVAAELPSLAAKARQIMKSSNPGPPNALFDLLASIPMLAAVLRDDFKVAAAETDPFLRAAAERALNRVPPGAPLAICYRDSAFLPGLEEQIRLLMPDILTLAVNQVPSNSVLVADLAFFLEHIGRGADPGRKNIVLLAENSDFARVKEHQPIVFTPPYNLNRICREILAALMSF